MTKLNAFVATAVAAMFVFGGAMAAAAQPADGEEPLMGQAEVGSGSTLTRAAVEAQAAQNPPADGQASEQRSTPLPASTRTRAQVEGQVAEEAREMGRFPDASGNAPAAAAK